jgi:hypothetical protein
MKWRPKCKKVKGFPLKLEERWDEKTFPKKPGKSGK